MMFRLNVSFSAVSRKAAWSIFNYLSMQKAFPHLIHIIPAIPSFHSHTSYPTVAPPEVDTIRSTNPEPIPLSSLLFWIGLVRSVSSAILCCQMIQMSKMSKMHGLPVRITVICGRKRPYSATHLEWGRIPGLYKVSWFASFWIKLISVFRYYLFCLITILSPLRCTSHPWCCGGRPKVGRVNSRDTFGELRPGRCMVSTCCTAVCIPETFDRTVVKFEFRGKSGKTWTSFLLKPGMWDENHRGQDSIESSLSQEHWTCLKGSPALRAVLHAKRKQT